MIKTIKNKSYLVMLTLHNLTGLQLGCLAHALIHSPSACTYASSIKLLSGGRVAVTQPDIRQARHTPSTDFMSASHGCLTPWTAVTLHFYNILVEEFHSTAIRYTLAYLQFYGKSLINPPFCPSTLPNTTHI